MLLKDQMFCTSACQGDPISAFLFILTFEISFIFIKKYLKIKSKDIFEHCFLYNAYADMAFFLLMHNPLKTYLIYIKSEIVGLGTLKRTQLVVCVLALEYPDIYYEAI